MKFTDVYPTTEYLKAADLTTAVRVRIADATIRTFRDQKTNEENKKIVLSFERAKKQLVCNRTQAAAVAIAVGVDDIEKWPGKELVLSGGIGPTGTPTVVVSPVVTAPPAEDNPFNS